MPLSDDDIKQMLDAGITEDEIAKELESEAGDAAPVESDISSMPDASVPDSANQMPQPQRTLGQDASAFLVEPALQMGSGALAHLAGSVKYGYGDDNRSAKEQFIQAHTFQPRTEAGQVIPKAIASVIDRASKGLASAEYSMFGDGESAGDKGLKQATIDLLKKHGHPALAGAIDPALDVGTDISTVLGVGGLAQRASTGLSKAASAKDAAKQAALDATKSGDSKIIKSFQDGQKHGLVAVPAEIPHSQTGRGWQSAGGKTLSEADASVHNADKMHEVLAKENGFEKNQPIMNDDIDARVEEEIKSGYDPVTKNLVAINFDKQYFNDLKKIGELESKASAPKRGVTKTPVIDLVNEYSDVHPFMDGDEAVAMIKDLRAKSSALYAKGENNQLAKAHKDIANSIEDLIERHADPEMLHDLRESRRNIAKLETLRDVIDHASGKVDPTKVAQLDVQSNRLTGRTKEMALFARNFPKSTSNPHVSLARQNMSTTSHLTGGTIGALKGEGAISEILGAISGAVGLSKARELMRKHILSPKYQEDLVPDYKQPPSLLSKLPQQESPMNPAYGLPGFLQSDEDQQ